MELVANQTSRYVQMKERNPFKDVIGEVGIANSNGLTHGKYFRQPILHHPNSREVFFNVAVPERAQAGGFPALRS